MQRNNNRKAEVIQNRYRVGRTRGLYQLHLDIRDSEVRLSCPRIEARRQELAVFSW